MKHIIDMKSIRNMYDEVVHDSSLFGSVVFQALAILFLLFIDTELFWRLLLTILAVLLVITLIRASVLFKKRPSGIVIPRNFAERIQHSSLASSHAATSFAFAVTVGLQVTTGAFIFLLILAAIVSLSRLHLKKHFPSDVATGTIIGIVMAVLINVILWA